MDDVIDRGVMDKICSTCKHWTGHTDDQIGGWNSWVSYGCELDNMRDVLEADSRHSMDCKWDQRCSFDWPEAYVEEMKLGKFSLSDLISSGLELDYIQELKENGAWVPNEEENHKLYTKSEWSPIMDDEFEIKEALLKFISEQFDENLKVRAMGEIFCPYKLDKFERIGDGYLAWLVDKENNLNAYTIKVKIEKM